MFSKVKNAVKKKLRSSSFLLSKHMIILESSPDYQDSTKYVYDELIRRGVNKKCKIYWFLNGETHKYDHRHNVFFINRNSAKAHLIQWRAKYIIDSNNYINKLRNNQFRIYLSHGSPIKMPYDYCRDIGDVDYITVSSDFFIEPCMDLFQKSREVMLPIGLARNDGFLGKQKVKNPYAEKYSKIIAWMPTYRNHLNPNGKSTNIHFNYGVPIIQNEKEVNTLNAELKKQNALLLIWMHPMEDLSKIKPIEASNIKIFDRDFYTRENIQQYDFLKEMDAMITDYSSIYYDFLLTRKPIAVTIPDLKEYTDSYPICGKSYKDTVKAYYLNTFPELLGFIKDFLNGKAMFTKEMSTALKRYHSYQDGKNSARVVDLLIKEMQKHEKSN